jgi:Skp family chaperone for outer membrane proteins
MKKLILTTLIASCLFSSVRAQDAQNILVVDVVAVVNGFYEAQTTQMKFNSNVESVNAKIQDMAKQGMALQDAAETLNKNMQDPKNSVDGAAMYKKELDEKIAELNDLKNSITDFRQKNLDELNQLQSKIVKEEMDKVQNAVGVIAKKHNSSLVLNSAGLGSVVYHKPEADITTEVLDLLNQGATPPPTPAATLPVGAGTTAAPALTLPSTK